MTGARTSKTDLSNEMIEFADIAPYLDVLNNFLTSPCSDRYAVCPQLHHTHLLGVSGQPALGHLMTSSTFTVEAY
jgi:hypothetical protein